MSGEADPNYPKTYSRKEVIKSTIAGLTAGVASRFFGEGQATAQDKKPVLGERIMGLYDLVGRSSLPDSSENPLIWSKESVARFLQKAEQAGTNFEILAANPRVSEIRQAVRKRYSNPDIDVDDQIFFLRDKKLFDKTLVILESTDWGGSAENLQQLLYKTIQTTDKSITEIETQSPPDQRRLTAKSIIENYSLIGTSTPPVIPTIAMFDEPRDNISDAQKTSMTQRLSAILQTMPIPRLAVSVFFEDRDVISANFKDRPWENENTQLNFGVPINERPEKQDQADLIIYHEVSHVGDIVIDPKLMAFLTTEQIVFLDLLRERAINEGGYSGDSKILMQQQQLRGWQIDPRYRGALKKDGQTRTERDWLMTTSQQGQINKKEYDMMWSIYPNSLWIEGLTFLQTPLQATNEAYNRLRTQLKPSYSWVDFLSQNSGVLEQVARSDKVFAEGYALLKKKVASLDPTVPQVAVTDYNFYQALQLSIVSGLLETDHFKSLLPPDVYQQLLDQLVMQNERAEKEGFAENVSIALFLSKRRNQDLKELSPAYLGYYNKLEEFFKITS